MPTTSRRLITAGEIETAASVRLADRCKHELGFVPPAILEQLKSEAGLYTLAWNGQPAGFLGWRIRRGTARIYYTAVEESVRRILNASMMVTALALESLLLGVGRLRLWCAMDLPANDFWADIGAEIVCHDAGKHQNKRPRTLYRIRCEQFLRSEFAQELEPCQSTNSVSVPCSSMPVLTLPATSLVLRVGRQKTEPWRSILRRLRKSQLLPDSNASEIVSGSASITGHSFKGTNGRDGSNSVLPSLSLRPDLTYIFSSPSFRTTTRFKRQSRKPEST